MLWRLATIAILFPCVLHPQSSQSRYADPVDNIISRQVLSVDDKGLNFKVSSSSPHWWHSTSSTDASLHVLTLGASTDTEYPIHIDGCTKAMYDAVDINGSQTTIVFSGNCLSAAGYQYNFLVYSNPVTHIHTAYHTGAYRISSLHLDSDGSVWTIGSRPGETKATLYGVLRHYNSEGVLIEQALPSVASGSSFGVSASNFPSAYLAVTPKDIYIYNANLNVLSVFQRSTHKLRELTIRGTNLIGRQMTGFAVTSSGRVYASYRKISAANGTLGGSRKAHGLFALKRLNNDNAVFVPVMRTISWATQPGDFLRLFGAADDKLVYAVKPSKQHSLSLTWALPDPLQ